MTAAPLVFMDTETTGLALTDDIWEFAAIRREPDGTESEWHMFIEHDRAKCGNLPSSFRDDHYNRYLDHKAYTQKQACNYIADIFRNGKPHVVGAVPQFDTERITLMVETTLPHWPQGIGWHYHLIDVENLAVGYLNGLSRFDGHECKGGVPTYSIESAFADVATPPWNSDELSKALGVDPEQFERHTAMGDVRWAMAIYDAVMGGAS